LGKYADNSFMNIMISSIDMHTPINKENSQTYVQRTVSDSTATDLVHLMALDGIRTH